MLRAAAQHRPTPRLSSVRPAGFALSNNTVYHPAEKKTPLYPPSPASLQKQTQLAQWFYTPCGRKVLVYSETGRVHSVIFGCDCGRIILHESDEFDGCDEAETREVLRE